jgi:hypothetical protein
MAGIFINYRTDDTATMGALIDRELCATFGEDRVFRDCRSMEPGVHFPGELERKLHQSTVLLVIIGEDWLTLTDGSGESRVKNPHDFVRWEIRESLKRSITVIPVLVDDAKLPPREKLPEDIQQLVQQQYVQVRTRYDRQDIGALVQALKKHVPVLDADGRATPGGSSAPQFNFYDKVSADVIGVSYRLP